MSETDTPIMPPPNVMLPSCDAGFISYRAAFTSLRVDPRPNNGRLVTVNDDGHIVSFDLTAEQAGFLASLLATPTGARETAA